MINCACFIVIIVKSLCVSFHLSVEPGKSVGSCASVYVCPGLKVGIVVELD